MSRGSFKLVLHMSSKNELISSCTSVPLAAKNYLPGVLIGWGLQACVPSRIVCDSFCLSSSDPFSVLVESPGLKSGASGEVLGQAGIARQAAASATRAGSSCSDFQSVQGTNCLMGMAIDSTPRTKVSLKDP